MTNEPTPPFSPAADVTRRKFLRALAALVPGPVLLAACRGTRTELASPTLVAPTASAVSVSSGAAPTAQSTMTAITGGLFPTPACADDDEVVVEQTEGPFFSPNSPERTSLLEEGMAGTTMVLSGEVVTTRCEPVAGALLDFWHADDSGAYDNVGYKLRGHQYTAADGSYRLETIVPGLYPGRTRHFHVKLQAPGQPVLTTQLHFPDEPSNSTDGIFDSRLVIDVADDGAGAQTASFRFVVDI